MSIEQEISGAEREALERAAESCDATLKEIMAYGLGKSEQIQMALPVWLAARDYYKAQFLEQNGKLGAATAAIQRERDEAEQRADMAEGREKKLRQVLEEIASFDSCVPADALVHIARQAV